MDRRRDLIDLVILKALMKLLILSMEVCLKQEMMKYQNLHLQKKLKLKLSDETLLGFIHSNFHPICSALTNLLITHPSSFSDLSLFPLSSKFSFDLCFWKLWKELSNSTSNEYGELSLQKISSKKSFQIVKQSKL